MTELSKRNNREDKKKKITEEEEAGRGRAWLGKRVPNT